jgi:hypothetical protein
MIDSYVQVKLTPKEVILLAMAAESKITEFHDQIARIEKETGKQWEGGDIGEWDANDIALLQNTSEHLRKFLDSKPTELEPSLLSGSFGRIAGAKFCVEVVP